MEASMVESISRRTRAGLCALAAVVALAATAGTAAGQETYPRISIDPRAGVGFPVGDLADTHDLGFAGGAGVAAEVQPGIAIRGDVDVLILDDESPQFGTVLAPTLTVVHFHGGVEFDFARPRHQDVPLTLRWSLGAGGTSMSASRDFPDGEDVDFSATYPSVNSALKVGYRVTRSVEFFVGGGMFLTFADDEEIAELVKRVPSRAPYETVWSAPVTLGLKAAF